MTNPDWTAIRAELERHEHTADAKPADAPPAGMWAPTCPCGFNGNGWTYPSRAQALEIGQLHVDSIADFLRED